MTAPSTQPDASPQAVSTLQTPGLKPHVSLEERLHSGKKHHTVVPRTAHAQWSPSPDRLEPIAILESQDATRMPDLVPIRYGRMLESPFAFYRGAAAIMAGDLSKTRFARIARNPEAETAFATGIGRQLVRGGTLLDRVRGHLFSRASGNFGALDGVIVVREQPQQMGPVQRAAAGRRRWRSTSTR